MAEDVKDMQRRLKEMEVRRKMEEKMEKRKMKDEKMRMKLAKREDKMRKKIEKKGKMPPEGIKPSDSGISDKEPMGTGEKIVKAEIVEFKPREWERKSVHSIDEVEKKIDRFSGKGVESLSERYRNKYGEDLKVPELYQIETSIEMKDDLDKYLSEDEEKDDAFVQEEKEEPSKGGFFSKPSEPAEEFPADEGERQLRFLDMSSGAMYLSKKHGRNAGGGKKAVLAIVDIILLIFLLPIRILTTLYYVLKRRKARKGAGSQNGFSAAEA
jgi:hypothetical protein